MQLNGNLSARRAAARGFTLIEVLITLVIVSVGLLGLAKLEAAAMAETQVSRVRALMTMQAESIASMMRSNRTFWGATTGAYADVTLTANGTSAPALIDTYNVLDSSKPDCLTSCSGAQLAYDDFYRSFGASFSKAFNGSRTRVLCNGSASLPTTCDITLTWQERSAVAINRTANDATAAAVKPVTMVLHVQP